MEKVWDLIIKLRNEKMGLVFFFFFWVWVFFFESGAPLLEPELREHARKRGDSCVCVCEGERENKNCLVVFFLSE